MGIEETLDKTELALFRERTEPASKIKLAKQMAMFNDIRKLLTTPAKELDERYRNLVEEVLPEDFEKTTLKDLVLDSMSYSSKWKTFFSMSGDKLNGFFAYQPLKYPHIVLDFKMFSFELDRSVSWLMDLKAALSCLVQEYDWVHWEAFRRNEIGNKIYRKAIEHFGGKSFESKRPNGEEIIDYFVPGVKELPTDIEETYKKLEEHDFEA